MKLMKLFPLLIAVFLIGNILNAQSVYQVTASEVEYKGNMQPSLVVNIEPNNKEVKKAWEDYIKDEFDVKFKGKWELVAQDVNIGNISSNPLTLITLFTDNQPGTKMNLLLSFEKKTIANPVEFPAEYNSMKKIFNAFLDGFLLEHYTALAKSSKKEAKKLTKKNKSIVKENKKLTKKLEANIAARQELTNALDKYEGAIEALQVLIDELQAENIEIENTIQQNQNALLTIKEQINRLTMNQQNAELKVMQLKAAAKL